MKCITALTLALFLSFNLFAQEVKTSLLDKGTQQVGFSYADMSSDDAFGAQVYLRYGYFVLHKLQVGVDVNSGARDFNIFYASGGPYIKYHIKRSWFSPYATVSTDFGICDYTDQRAQYWMTGKLAWQKYFMGAGVGFYGVNDHWGFETAIGYQYEQYQRNDDGRPESNFDKWTNPIRWRITYAF
ncbi:hypothetical protein KFE98_18485 [bacterium SCSIO 12741]|nr:hypothetical protein KFE98_18485 [bacterium SCSIO 12741]